ncbi:MAG: prepilin-type N-terminal cleavage/methylation domain-containing protein [Victivallales bacterium]
MKDNDRAGGLSCEHEKRVTQRISLNLNPELCHDENVFQDFAERVPHHDFVSNAEICHNSRLGMVSQGERNQFLPCLTSPLFLPLLNCFNVQLFQCFLPSSFSVPCSIFLLRRVKIRIFTLIELLMRESCKSGISFRQQQGRTEHCQSPDLTSSSPSSSFFPLLNCFNVQLFQCFLPSSFPVPCSIFLLRRVKTRIFTLIELLIVIAIICIL